MEINGQIEDIIYQNEINGYTIASFKTEQETITIVGYLPFINSGDTLKVIGKFVMHSEYGRQFKIDTFEKTVPQTIEALQNYLANGTLKGIGPATAKRIVQAFGEDTMHVIKYEPQKLANIKGISEARATEISDSFIENWELWQIVNFLNRFGIGQDNAKKIYKTLGKNAIEQIEINPYLLIDIARNIDFKQIDKVAIESGISYDNDKRVKSGIKYSLILASYNGNCCVNEINLIEFVQELLHIQKENIQDNIINLKVSGELVIEEIDGVNWVYLLPFYKAETNVTSRLMILKNTKNIKKVPNIDKELKKVEKLSNITLSQEQIEALRVVNDNNVSIITGGPGTGKTTIIKSIIETYKLYGYKVVLCAPTGRAAKKMTETTGEQAKTLHRLLEIRKLEENVFETVDYEVIPIDADLIVVDEMSMVDIFLMNHLLKAIYQGSKLVLVGDIDQLSSVGPGSVLKDMIKSENIVTIKLTKIFRQAASSKIIVNAHKVNKGESFIYNKSKENLEIEQIIGEEVEDIEQIEDFFYIKEVEQEKILSEVISLSKDRLKSYGEYDFFKNIQILSPTKKGMLGTKELNKQLQKYLNPPSEQKNERITVSNIFRVGDRVMQVKNNYDIYWEKKEPEYEYGSGVYNGELGTIVIIDENEKQLAIKFDDDKLAWYDYQDLDQIELAYAITIHKAQRKRV